MATYSSGSTVSLRAVAEATYGTNPTGTPMKVLRAKPSNLSLKKDTYTTDEVRADRGISDVRHGLRKVEGSIEGDLMLLDWDDFIEAAMQGTWSNKAVRCGTNLRSFSIDQGFTDIAQYRLFKGCCISKMKISIKPGSMVGISFDIMGQDMTSGASAAANATTAASTSSPVSYAGGSIMEGGAAIAYITGLELELDNGLGATGVVGANIAPAIFNGRSHVKGTVTALFKDQTLLNKFVNETETSLSVTLVDPVGGQLTIALPKVKYTGGDINAPKDGATIITLPFEALHCASISSAAGTTLAITAQTGPGSATFTKVVGGGFTSFITEGFKVGDVITVKNATAGGNNGDWVVTNVTATVLTVTVPLGSTTVLQAAGAPGAGAGDIAVNPTNMSIYKF